MTLAEQLRAIQARLDHTADRDTIIGAANAIGELAEAVEKGSEDAPAPEATKAPKATKGKTKG